MTSRTSEAKRRAFFAAVRETGNQTLACERAKVSRSWMSLHRATDPAFRAALDDALTAARGRLAVRAAQSNLPLPPAGWLYAQGEELVLTAGTGKGTQIARARVRQFTPRIEARFLAVLAGTCNVKAACAAVGLTPAAAYAHRQRWRGFRERWRRAVDEGRLRLEMALIEAGRNLLEGADEAARAEQVLPAITADQALQTLRLYRGHGTGTGNPPGRIVRPASVEQTRDAIFRRIRAITGVDVRARNGGAAG